MVCSKPSDNLRLYGPWKPGSCTDLTDFTRFPAGHLRLHWPEASVLRPVVSAQATV